MTTVDLLTDLGLDSDFARLVDRVSQSGSPWVVVSSALVARLMRRDPAGWGKFAEWLNEQRVTLIRI